MTNLRYFTICIRLAFLTAIPVAVFWIFWSHYYAPIPASQTLKITSQISWVIPFWRGYDWALVFIIVNEFGWIYRLLWLWTEPFGYYEKFEDSEKRNNTLVFSLMLGIVGGGVVAGNIVLKNLATDIYIAVVFPSIAAAPFAAIVASFNKCNIIDNIIMASVSATFAVVIVIGAMYGFICSVVFGCVIFIVAVVIKIVTSYSFWKKIGDFILAKNLE